MCADKPALERLYDRRHAAVCARKLIREHAANRVHLIARAFSGDAVVQARVRELRVAGQTFACGRGRHHRHPHILRARKGEAPRHHADDARRLAVDSDDSADGIRARAERASPELVAQDHNRLSP